MLTLVKTTLLRHDCWIEPVSGKVDIAFWFKNSFKVAHSYYKCKFIYPPEKLENLVWFFQSYATLPTISRGRVNVGYAP